MRSDLFNSRTWNHKLTRTGRDVSYEWESFEDYLTDFEAAKKLDPQFVAGHLHDGGMWGSDWYGTTGGWKAVMHNTLNGWPELRDAMLKKLDGLELELPVFPSNTCTRRRKIKHMEHGDVLHMSRVWGGQLDKAWDRPVRQERMAQNFRRISLAFDVTANGGVTNEQALWRGALCMLLVDSLARAGRTFEIYIVDSTSHPFAYGQNDAPGFLWTSWLVKPTHQPVVPDRLAAMVSVGFMRVSGFAAENMGPWAVSSGLGGAHNAGLPHSLRERADAGEIVLRVGECYSKNDVIKEYSAAWERIEQAAAEAA